MNKHLLQNSMSPIGKIETPKMRAIKNALNALFWLMMLVGLVVMSFSYIYIDVKVSGPSMQPTINAQWSNEEPHKQDVAYINKYLPYSRGDIIVAKREDNIHVIKRLIGIEGDRIGIVYDEEEDEIQLFLNGEVLQEDYVAYKAGLQATLSNFNQLKISHEELFEGEELVVPEGQVFYLGDNRGQSQDCALYGPVDRADIVGRVNIIVPYGQTFLQYMWGSFLEIFS